MQEAVDQGDDFIRGGQGVSMATRMAMVPGIRSAISDGRTPSFKGKGASVRLSGPGGESAGIMIDLPTARWDGTVLLISRW
ncbi:hypothetical protein [Nonomuraea turcica]|uniref:hypothetical protein n=1 Tax=Nonomuraea sp. G32 TaxID=3067274 RepID=UPI00273A82F5|nr:hypothetical protein [Nonomuraea sp. G32]MDP4505322.1 hypothetical protein [Nonomuraea sp. G32]